MRSLPLQGTGGPECDFLPVIQLDSYVALQSGPSPMAHVGTLPSGQMTAPAQTPVNNDTAHFKVQYQVRSDKSNSGGQMSD